jgi:hypothetical protein
LENHRDKRTAEAPPPLPDVFYDPKWLQQRSLLANGGEPQGSSPVQDAETLAKTPADKSIAGKTVRGALQISIAPGLTPFPWKVTRFVRQTGPAASRFAREALRQMKYVM